MTGNPGRPDRAGHRDLGQVLSAAEFADLAAGHRAVIIEQSLLLIRECDLPDDWLATTLDCYSTESGYYELAQYGHTQPLKARVNDFVAERLARSSAGAVLDVGVGDGHRLAQIAALVAQRGGRPPQLYGIELSERMIERARQRGIEVVKQDMRTGIPDLGRELDGILFLSGDLGYLMDPATGPALRSRVLDSAYQHLSGGGTVVLELISRDPRVAPDGADVFFFSRVPTMRDEQDELVVIRGPETWQYIKTFSKPEIVALVESSRFDLSGSSMHYVVRDSSDLGRIGRVVDEGELTPDESYRLVVSLVK